MNTLNRPRPDRHPPRAFTLIELLVVIAIIALLAGLVVYLLPGVTEKRVRGRVKAELAALELAINAYKSKIGFYPPDNPNDSARSPLFYELTGTQRIQPDPNVEPVFQDRDTIRLMTNTIGTYFATSGFINSDPDPRERREFCTNLKTNTSYRAIAGSPGVELLMVPYKGPDGDFNPWHYNSSNPQYHPEAFDLWAVVVIAGKTNTIGNWKE